MNAYVKIYDMNRFYESDLLIHFTDCFYEVIY